jgi:hypothetical protein
MSPLPRGETSDVRHDALAAELLQAALGHARRGRPIFPVRQDLESGRKIPLIKWKNGASTDESQIRAWWSIWPLAMIAMPTGRVSGIIVIDIDVKNGANGFATLERLGWPVANAPRVSTPSGGAHLYFRYPPFPVRNSAGRIGPGIDVRGDGGMVILPPSRPRLNGLDYALERDGEEPHPLDWSSP